MITPLISAERARDHYLPRQIDGFVEQLVGADLGTKVSTCPGWTVRDLVVHVGNVHRWVVQAMTTGNAEDPAPADTPDHAVARWYRGVADEMLDLFATRTPDSPCWTFGMPPRTAAFWFRRQTHEVAMHRWDLTYATGGRADYDPELAADGIDEIVRIFFPRQVQLGRTEPLTSSLALAPDHSDDSGHSDERWVLSGDGNGPAADPDATVSGPATALLLLLWGRIHLTDDRLAVTGSRTAAERVLSAGLVP